MSDFFPTKMNLNPRELKNNKLTIYLGMIKPMYPLAEKVQFVYSAEVICILGMTNTISEGVYCLNRRAESG